MRTPSARDRASLDEAIQGLARVSRPLTIDDFRTKTLKQASQTALRIRVYIVCSSLIFLTATLSVLLAQGAVQPTTPNAEISAALWSFSLGGLGAVSSIFLHLLKLAPQQSINSGDEFEVVGRIILGCLFATVLSITLSRRISDFFLWLEGQKTGSTPNGPMTLLPFLLGYSIPLVLRIIEKVIQAVEVTIGAEDTRSSNRRQRQPNEGG